MFRLLFLDAPTPCPMPGFGVGFIPAKAKSGACDPVRAGIKTPPLQQEIKYISRTWGFG
jgi:hypothetical protein